MLGLVGLFLWLVCVICWIIVLIKLFQDKGILHGILGLICWLYTFIWGWINAGRLNIRNIMLIWTALLILSIVINGAAGGFNYHWGTTTP